MSLLLASGGEQMELESDSGGKFCSVMFGLKCLAALKSQIMGNDVQGGINVLESASLSTVLCFHLLP